MLLVQINVFSLKLIKFIQFNSIQTNLVENAGKKGNGKHREFNLKHNIYLNIDDGNYTVSVSWERSDLIALQFIPR